MSRYVVCHLCRAALSRNMIKMRVPLCLYLKMVHIRKRQQDYSGYVLVRTCMQLYIYAALHAGDNNEYHLIAFRQINT